jgi:hypothetical protein
MTGKIAVMKRRQMSPEFWDLPIGSAKMSNLIDWEAWKGEERKEGFRVRKRGKISGY